MNTKINSETNWSAVSKTKFVNSGLKILPNTIDKKMINKTVKLGIVFVNNNLNSLGMLDLFIGGYLIHLILKNNT